MNKINQIVNGKKEGIWIREEIIVYAPMHTKRRIKILNYINGVEVIDPEERKKGRRHCRD